MFRDYSIDSGTLKWPAISIEKVVGQYRSAVHFSVPLPIPITLRKSKLIF